VKDVSVLALGYRGGFLSHDEIHADLDKIFYSGTVPEPKKQIQQAGIDLTIRRITKGPFDREVPFGSDGWCHLPSGRYWVEFNEIPKAPEEEYAFHLWPKSTHFRYGNLLGVGLTKYAGSRDGLMGASIDIDNPHGLWLEQNAALCQAMVESQTKVFALPHGPWLHSTPLTVERLFRFTSEARLGKTERLVETKEVESGLVQLGSESFLVRYVETIEVAPDSVVTSLKDNPFPFLWAMGAVADPGYSGKLHSCLSSLHPYVVKVGMPMLQLRMDRITPVSTDKLYQGRYQDLGLGEGEEASVQWLSPADPSSWLQARDLWPVR
jgi:deoxycytidine triphosphate deaminase